MLSPRAAVEAAVRDGVTVLALTDHDTLTGIPEARQAATECGIELVAGVEVSCGWGRESVHLLGLFVDPGDRALTALFDEVSERRRQRIAETCRKLSEAGVALRFEEVAAMSTGRSLGRPHVADALVHKGTVRDRGEAFDRYLGDGKVGHVRYGWKIGVDEAAKMVHAAGGISSVAHPKYLRDQSALPSMLRETGVRALEAYHVEQDGDEREHYLSVADSLGLMVSGGSDFHEPKHGRRFGSELPPERYEELRAAAGRG